MDKKLALMMARNRMAGDRHKEKIEFDRRLLKVECLVIHHPLSQTHLSGNSSMQKNNILPAVPEDCLYIISMLSYLRSGECVCVV